MQVDSNSSHVMYTCENDGYDLFQEYRLRDCGLKSDIRRGTVRNVPVFVLSEYPPVSCLPLSLPPNLFLFSPSVILLMLTFIVVLVLAVSGNQRPNLSNWLLR